MKTILSTLLAVGVLSGAAHAETFNPFNDPKQALPHSDVSNDDYRQALPRSVISGDEHRQALPFIETVFPDINTATP